MDNIGDRIKQKRRKLGLTQAELGEKLNITDRAVSKWEQGEGDPNLSIIPDIAKVLGVSLDYLLLGKEEEPAITLDDMDAEKRLSLLIKKDDNVNFKKYEYQASAYVFGRSVGYRSGVSLCELNKKTWLEIINSGAKKIFKLCCDELVKKNTQKVWSAFLMYDFLDDFVKMVIDVDRADVLESIGFRIFAIGNKPANSRGRDPFQSGYDFKHYIFNVETYFISADTFEYIFKKKKESPQCYEYATTMELQIMPLGNSYNNRLTYTYTHLHDWIVKFAIQYNDFELVRTMLGEYNKEISKLELERNDFVAYSKTYVYTEYAVIGRIFHFTKEAIESLLLKSQVELAKELISFNKAAYNKIMKLKSSYSKNVDDIFIMSESEVERFIKLNSDLPEEEMTRIKCIRNKIIIPNEIQKLRDLKLVRDILDHNYYHYYEFVYDSITKGNLKDLFEFFVDNGFDDLARYLMRSDPDFNHLLSNSWILFNLKPGYTTGRNGSYEDNKKLLENQNQLNVNNYAMINFEGKNIDTSSECSVVDGNQIIAYIKSLKEDIYNSVENQVNTELKEKQDAIERTKIVKGLDKEYFEGLLAKKGLFSKKEQRLFILDLCSLLDAIFKFDYKCTGEDFYERMTCFFNRMSEQAPKSRDMDDGWGYMVLDDEYENEVVIPEKNRIEHLMDIFNRLRIQRNNIAHSESKKVQELNEDELRECLEFAFSINKERK